MKYPDLFKDNQRILICSYSEMERLSKRYPNRKIVADMYCPNDEAYFRNRNGFSKLDLNDFSIWHPIWDENGWRSGLIKRVYPAR